MIFFNACSIKYEQNLQNKNSTEDKKTIHKLQKDIEKLSLEININEARELASRAILYSKHLANEYELVTPPLFHNTLIQIGIKKRGLCFHFAQDLIDELKKQDFKTVDLHWVVHDKTQYWEHSSIVVTAKDKPIENGIILDAWRNSGKLFWSHVTDDTRYHWVEDILRSKYYGTIK